MPIEHELKVPAEYTLKRLDQAVATLLPQYSRSRLQQWIKEGDLTVDGRTARSRDKLQGGELIKVSVEINDESDAAEDIPLDIVFEDEHLIIVNKPPGLVVHPGAGNTSGTLLNALLNHDPGLANVPRAGIVHRLDKETSGLLVVARTLESQNLLVQAIQDRVVNRIYDALVYGIPNRIEGTIEGAVGRHPVHRKKMSLRQDGKPAVTRYQVKQTYQEHALVECRLETGRTHQIRVHMQSIGHPLIGDPTYGGHYRRPRFRDEYLEEALKEFGRQALHARRLAFEHPVTKKNMDWKVPMPDDMAELVDLLDV